MGAPSKAMQEATKDYYNGLKRFYHADLDKEEARAEIRRAQDRLRKLARTGHHPVMRSDGQQSLV